MTDAEYATNIYCAVLGLKASDGDVYVQGVFDVLAELPERDRLAMQYRFRENMTYIQIGKIFGISNSRAQQIVTKDLFRLRKPKNIKRIHISNLQKEYDELQKRLQEKEKAYEELFDQMIKLYWGEEIDDMLQKQLRHRRMTLLELGFSQSIVEALVNAGIETCEELLTLSSERELYEIPYIGYGSVQTILSRMRKLGFSAWVDKMEKG